MSKKKKKIKAVEKKISKKSSVSIVETLKEKKGFTIAIIVFVIALILLVLIYALPQQSLSEEYAYAALYYQENDAYLNEVIAQADIELQGTLEEELDEYYLNSVKSDMIWLREKNFDSLNSSDELFLRVAATTVFIDRIIELNENFSIDFIEPDYEIMIELASEIKYSLPSIIDAELEVELSEKELNIVNETFDKLAKEYFNLKINIINNSIDIKEKFVESKKIVYFYSQE